MKLLALFLCLALLVGCQENSALTGEAVREAPITEEIALIRASSQQGPSPSIAQTQEILSSVRDRSKTYHFDSGSKPRIRSGAVRKENIYPATPVVYHPYTAPAWIQERQALERNTALRCTDYYAVYELYFLDVKQELQDFQQRYLTTLQAYQQGTATRTAIDKAALRMREKEVVYLKVQEAFQHLNQECNKTYTFEKIQELFIEIVDFV